MAIEARLLAEDGVANIAAKLDLSKEAVACYGNIFFDVARYLDKPDVILGEVIGFPWGPDDRRPWCDRGWKLFGYLGGVEVLEEVMATPSRTIEIRWRNSREIVGILTDAARVRLEFGLAQAVENLAERDGKTAAELLRLGEAMAAETEDRDVASNYLARQTRRFWEAIGRGRGFSAHGERV
jgi:hypothetical protein